MDKATLLEIEIADLILQVDTGRAAGDPFKLPAALSTLVTTRLATAQGKNAAATLADASTVGGSAQKQQAVDKLKDLLRNGFKHIESIPSDDLPDADRAQVFTAYGWKGSVLGDLENTERLEGLAAEAVTATADATVPTAGKYPATLVTRITNWAGILAAANLLATGGSRQVLIQQRNDARDELHDANMRVRAAYAAASDDGESTPELAKINMQPKRKPGDAKPPPDPAAPGNATFNPATRELTIPAMPAHATFIRSYRQPAGGSAVAAGVSSTPTVSVISIGPLTAGVTYQLWVVGVNSQGEGADSNKVGFTA
jgi:hypothetical protein